MPDHLKPLTGKRFGSFAELSKAIHDQDVRRAEGLRKTRPAREANRRRAELSRA